MTTQEMLDDRYGRTPSTRRRWIAGIAIAVAAVVVGAIAWTAVSNAGLSTDASVTAFHVQDDRTVVVEFQLSAPTGRRLACAIEAQDEQHGVVGWRIVEFEASDLHTRAYTETVPTVAPATTGLVNSCWVT